MKLKTCRSEAAILIAYCLTFYGVWTIWEFGGKACVEARIAHEGIAQLMKFGVIKNMVWTLPAMALLRAWPGKAHAGLREILFNRVAWKRYLPLFLLFTVYLLGGLLLQKGQIALSGAFTYSQLIVVLFVGITEEMVFRG